MTLSFPNRSLSWPRRGCVMGILNINDDSFSGDGKVDQNWARERAREMIQEGADIVDIGAESARTNRKAISVQEEVDRLSAFCEKWDEVIAHSKPRDNDQVWPPLLSINTWRPEVVAAITKMKIDIINDMSGLPDDQNARLCAESKAALLIMHSVGAPKEDHSHTRWDNILEEMKAFFIAKIALCEAAGLSREQIILDPGFGFAKQPSDDLAILADLRELTSFERPLLLPVGRKGFIGETLHIPEPAERDAATLACVAAGSARGAAIYRVHEVKGCFEALKVLETT